MFTAVLHTKPTTGVPDASGESVDGGTKVIGGIKVIDADYYRDRLKNLRLQLGLGAINNAADEASVPPAEGQRIPTNVVSLVGVFYHFSKVGLLFTLNCGHTIYFVYHG